VGHQSPASRERVWLVHATCCPRAVADRAEKAREERLGQRPARVHRIVDTPAYPQQRRPVTVTEPWQCARKQIGLGQVRKQRVWPRLARVLVRMVGRCPRRAWP
jgi:hypothetical protein